jgi:hypothetical protein
MKAKLLIDGKELEVEISEEELKKLEAKQRKKTGYERVELCKKYYYIGSSGEVNTTKKQNVYEDDLLTLIGNCYSDRTVAKNNARADKLMRQLRRFAVEHRERELNWADTNERKYYIRYNHNDDIFFIDWCCIPQGFGLIHFDSGKITQLAIDTFHDELVWYFTEYKDSL